MSLDDVYGPNPNRPDHPDMEKISEILVGMDTDMDPEKFSHQELEEKFKAKVAELDVDLGVISFAALQRAFRVLKVVSKADLDPETLQDAINLSSAWLDGFIAGRLWSKETTMKGKERQ